VWVTKAKTSIDEVRPLFDGSINLRGYSGLNSATATASSGICCYRECLQGMRIDAAAMRLIHVVPGHIERGSAQYDILSDGGSKDQISPLSEPVTLGQVDSANPKFKPISLGNFRVKVLASESSTYRNLTLFYKVFLPGGLITQISPGRLSNQVLERTGILTCHRNNKCKQQLATPCSAFQKGWTDGQSTLGLKINAQIAVCLWSYQEDIARCIALVDPGRKSEQNVFIRRNECLPCCSESILRERSTIIAGRDIVGGLPHVI